MLLKLLLLALTALVANVVSFKLELDLSDAKSRQKRQIPAPYAFASTPGAGPIEFPLQGGFAMDYFGFGGIGGFGAIGGIGGYGPFGPGGVAGLGASAPYLLGFPGAGKTYPLGR